MLQGWRDKVVTILLYYDCFGIVGTTLQQVWLCISMRMLQLWDKPVDGLLTDLLQDVRCSVHVYTRVKISNLVASLPTSRQQVVFTLLVPSCQQVSNKLLTTCNNLLNHTRLVARFVQQISEFQIYLKNTMTFHKLYSIKHLPPCLYQTYNLSPSAARVCNLTFCWFPYLETSQL